MSYLNPGEPGMWRAGSWTGAGSWVRAGGEALAGSRVVSPISPEIDGTVQQEHDIGFLLL